jgi:hypothetical protein
LRPHQKQKAPNLAAGASARARGPAKLKNVKRDELLLILSALLFLLLAFLLGISFVLVE